MRVFRAKKFTILFFSETELRGCAFQITAPGVCKCTAFAKSALSGSGSDAGIWKGLLKQLDYNENQPLMLCGALKDGVYFRTSSIPLPPGAMRSALELDLPQHLPVDSEHYSFEYALTGPKKAEDDGDPGVNLYAYPDSSLEKLTAMISQTIRKADAFLYPLLAVKPGDPPVFLKELDDSFFFYFGEWHPLRASDSQEKWIELWTKELSSHGPLPTDPDFDLKTYLPCFLAARYAADPEGAGKAGEGIDILPKQLKPSRFKLQLLIAAILLFLLILNSLWDSGNAYLNRRSELSRLNQEYREKNEKLTKLQGKVKSQEKELRELNKVIHQDPGDEDFVGTLYELSTILPTNVMLMNLRVSDSTIDCMMRTEETNLDLASVLKNQSRWKVDNLQQRRRGNESASTINLRLSSRENK